MLSIRKERAIADAMYGMTEVAKLMSLFEESGTQNGRKKFIASKSDIENFALRYGMRKDLRNILYRTKGNMVTLLEGELYPNLELNQTKRLATCITVGFNASQRMDMYQSQSESLVMPINGDYPIIASSLFHDIMQRNSCIVKASGKIKIIEKFTYQFRTIYVYELNGKYDIYDTDGYIDSNGYACQELSDLRHLPVGEEVDISQDDFYISHPSQFNPKSRTLGYGANVIAISSTSFDNSGDSAPMSESMVKKFATLKCKTIRKHLSGKTIVSKYPKLFPELGEIISDNILFKVVDDNGYVSQLAQNASLPTGDEDDTVIVEKNTYISSIEVYCNNTIENPYLEAYRQELLNFRTNVYNCLSRLVDYYPNSCSSAIFCYKGNFQHNIFHTEGKELAYPLIKMKTITISIPNKGSKFSNMFKSDPVHGNMCLKCA